MIQTISLKEFCSRFANRKSLQIIDVRSAGEFASGHIPGAVNIPLEQVSNRVNDLHAEPPLIMVCQSGKRARMAAEALQSKFNQVLILEGGTAAWIEQNQPIVRTTRTAWSLERQIRLIAGLLVLFGGVLALIVNPRWVYLSIFVGAGLAFAGLSGLCLMGSLLLRMPWNRSSPVFSAKLQNQGFGV